MSVQSIEKSFARREPPRNFQIGGNRHFASGAKQNPRESPSSADTQPDEAALPAHPRNTSPFWRLCLPHRPKE